MKKLVILSILLIAITFHSNATYRETCSVQTNDSSAYVNFNGISFTIPEKAYARQGQINHCNEKTGFMIIDFGSGVVLRAEYEQPTIPMSRLTFHMDWCAESSKGCKVLEYDSVPVPNYGSRYGYFKIYNYQTHYNIKYDQDRKSVV